MPIYRNEEASVQINRIKNSFLYVSSISSHKNHERLFKAFINASQKNNSKIELHLTIPENDFLKSIYNNLRYPKNLKIINHGILKKNKLYKLYCSSEFSIFPSLSESFGLPLLESVNNGTKVIAADLDYVNKYLPSLKFDPNRVFRLTLKSNKRIELKESKILVQNKIDTLWNIFQIMFKNKTLLITGGTGSFGNAVLEKFLKSDIKEIRIFSRDEKKQDDMRKLIKSNNIKYFIGDVRDLESVNNAMFGPRFSCCST